MHILFKVSRSFSIVLFILPILLGSCSDDSSDTTDNGNPQQEEQGVDENPTPTNNTARLSAKQLYEDFYVASATTASDSPWTGDEPSCNPGEIPQETKDKIQMRLSYYRQAVGLNNTIAENPTKSTKAQQAALMMNSNNNLDHFPPNSWKCFTTDGSEGAGNSLLALSRNAEAIDAYIRDQGANNFPVGHRRWLLWPRLQEIGIGNTDRSNAVWVLGNAGSVPADNPEFIAWPPQGYTPNSLVFPRWSFSVANADFTTTSIAMKDENDQNISLSIETLDNAFGDRTIVWVPDGVTTNISADTSYTVSLQNVIVDGESRNYEYEVILFDPLD
ncbi:MAG: CAP domain-containing protein [Bacteroidota bacterium]